MIPRYLLLITVNLYNLNNKLHQLIFVRFPIYYIFLTGIAVPFPFPVSSLEGLGTVYIVYP